MSYKKWVQSLLFLIFVLISIIILSNYLIDPYGVFYRNPNSAIEPNERYVKMNFISKENSKYNAFLVGSSRIGTTEPATIEKYLPNTRFYNFTVSAGTLGEWELLIKNILQVNRETKVIYLQVDLYDNFINYIHSKNQLMLRMKPQGYIENMDFYKSYLLSKDITTLRDQIKHDFDSNNPKNVKFDEFNTGCWYVDYKEQAIIKNAKEYIKNEKTFHKKEQLKRDSKVISENLEALKKIVNLCKQKNVKLIVFITSHNQHMFQALNSSDYLKFLNQMAQITPYWDFSGYNSITTNDANYYEYSHYRPHVAKLIAGRIFQDQSMEIPSDFGVYVTKENVQNHLQEQKEKLSKY